jgi:choline dehydrogenase
MKSPNAFTYTFPGPFLTPENAGRTQVPEHAWSMALGLNPQSRGTVSLSGPSASDSVMVDNGYLSNPQDLSDILAAIEQARSIGNSASFEPFTKRELLPGPIGGADLETFVRNGLVTFWHQCGTAKMGQDALANMTADEIRNGAYLNIEDPLQEFGNACRNELNKLYSAAT